MDNISVSWNKRYKFAKHFCMNNPFKKIFFCLVFWDLSAISSPIHTQISSLIVHPFVADINAHPDIFRQKLLQYCATNFQIVSSKMGTTSTTIRGNRQVKASFATYPREQENRVKICANV